MIGLNRTFTGRISSYSPDGFGRDSYIACNNGGIFKAGSLTRYNRKSSMDRSKIAPPLVQVQAKIARYESDGTGRDSYVSSNVGGLAFNPKSKPFHTSLRSWTPIMPKSNNYFYPHLNPLHQKQAIIANSQNQLNSRLSVPKHVEPKFLSSGSLSKGKKIYLRKISTLNNNYNN